MSDDPSRMLPMGRTTIHGEPDTLTSSYAREAINFTALVGDLSLKISDDGQCELIASIQINLNTVAELLEHQKPADMAGGDALCGGVRLALASRSGRSACCAGVAHIFERRQGHELFLGHIDHDMIRVVAITGHSRRCGGGGCSGRSRSLSDRGRLCRGVGRGVSGARLHDEL
jgi:hypothetical protein